MNQKLNETTGKVADKIKSLHQVKEMTKNNNEKETLLSDKDKSLISAVSAKTEILASQIDDENNGFSGAW